MRTSSCPFFFCDHRKTLIWSWIGAGLFAWRKLPGRSKHIRDKVTRYLDLPPSSKFNALPILDIALKFVILLKFANRQEDKIIYC